jgi:putative protein kinase ArgK-like GTPase of G3E family
MASKAEKVLKTQTFKGRGLNPSLAAIKYVNNGMKGLGLKPREQEAMRKKLIPIVERQIKTDVSRTVSRAKGVVNRESSARIKKAKRIVN